MAKVLSSISGNLISAASAGYAPTNGTDVSAIASAYAESAASGKQDSGSYLSSTDASAFYPSTANPSGYLTTLPSDLVYSADLSSYAYESSNSGKLDTSAIECDTASAITAIGGSSVGGGVVTATSSAIYYDTTTSASATGVSGINGSAIIASRIRGPLAQSGTAYSIWTSYWNSKFNRADMGICVIGSQGSGTFKENEIQLHSGTAGSITLNVGYNKAQVIATSTDGGMFSAGYSGSTAQANYLAFNSANKAQIGVGAHSASALFSGEKSFIRLCDSSSTGTIYASSISSWDAKLDSSAIECTTASAITAIGGSSIGGGVDSATVSAIASSYAESAASGKLDATASSQFVTSTANLATTAYVDSSVSSKLDTTAFSDVSSNFLTSETVTATAGDGTSVSSINEMPLLDTSVSATCSAIASAYAESAVSAVSGNYYGTGNPSGFITGVDLTPYQLTADMSAYAYESSNSAKLDATASSQFLTSTAGLVGTGDITSFAYESSVSGWTAKQDALTFGYNASNQISAIDGSALAGGGGGATIGTGEFLGYSIVSSDNVAIAGESATLQSSVVTPYTDTVWRTTTISANTQRTQFRIYNFVSTAGNMTSLPTAQTVRFTVTAVDAGTNLYDSDELALIVYTGTNSSSPVAKWNIGSLSNNKTATWNNTVTWNSTNQPNLLLTAYNSQLYNLTTTATYSAAGAGGITSESSLNVQVWAASPSSVSSIASSYANTKMDSTAVQSAYASASASQATANGVLYILIPDGV